MSTLEERKKAFDLDPTYNGQPLVDCDKCGLQMSPRGRSAPEFLYYCKHGRGPELWPGETREEFGFPRELAAESARLRSLFNA